MEPLQRTNNLLHAKQVERINTNSLPNETSMKSKILLVHFYNHDCSGPAFCSTTFSSILTVSTGILGDSTGACSELRLDKAVLMR